MGVDKIEAKERIRLMKLLEDQPIQEMDKNFVSRWHARRSPYNLSVKALKKLDTVALKGKKHGTEGIFYPVKDIRTAASEVIWVSPSFIPEVRITKQVQSSSYDLQELRENGVFGKKKGEPGKSHYFYSEETIERVLAINIIPSDWTEGKDYVALTRYPSDHSEISTKFAIHKSGPFRPAALYYWGKEATSIAKSSGQGPSRPQRIQIKEPVPDDESEGEESESDEEMDPELAKLDAEIANLKQTLAEKEYARKILVKAPIYSDSD